MLLSISTALLSLAVLACPIGMGAMMFFMMRGSGGQRKRTTDTATPSTRSIAELKAEHARLAEEIDRLEKPTSERDRVAR